MATPLERDCDQVRGATLAPSIVTRSTIVNLRTSDRQRAELIELTGKERGMWLVRSLASNNKVRDEAFARASAGHHPLVAIGIDTESRGLKGRARKARCCAGYRRGVCSARYKKAHGLDAE